MREELVRTQADVEKSMLDLHDEQMSHMISLGGWLRGFQLAANSCAQNYSPDRALVLGRVEIMDYYIDRLDTLHPRLKKTEFVSTITSRHQESARSCGGGTRPTSHRGASEEDAGPGERD